MEKTTLPLIYSTNIPNQVKEEIILNNPLIVVTAPTGLGKTFFLTRLLAELPKTSHILMPYRISVKEMHSYVESFDNYQYGYRMRGESNGNQNDDCTMFTVGYWLEYFIGYFRNSGNQIKKKHIIVIDECHDTSWQTDLALKFLLWLQNNGAPIQIILSSATMDITENIKMYEPKIFSAETKKANVDMKFLKSSILSIEKGRMSDDLKEAIIRRLIKLATTSVSGDCFVLLPGEQEIYDIRTVIEANPLFSEFSLHDLYGELSKEEQEEAIKPNPDRRKIVFTTNIAECAITIKGGVYVIDSCLRKENHISNTGISQLVLIQASQANIKQFSGRVGREGIRGTAYIMLSQNQYDRLRPFPKNETERNPLYHQIMKLLSNDLPVNDILSSERIESDLMELIKVGAVSLDGKITKIGKLISVLPLSLQAGSFLANIITSNLDKSYFHIACSIASWIDLTTSVFMIPRRKPKESQDRFELRVELLKEAQEQFHGKDCLETFLKIWVSRQTTEVGKWCFKNGIYDRSIKEIFNNTNHCIDSLKREGIIIPEYKLTEKHIPQISKVLTYFLSQSFPNRIFDKKYDKKSRSYYYVSRNNNKDDPIKYIKDQATDYYSSPDSVIALGLRKSASGKVVFMSKLIIVESVKVESDNDSDDIW